MTMWSDYSVIVDCGIRDSGSQQHSATCPTCLLQVTLSKSSMHGRSSGDLQHPQLCPQGALALERVSCPTQRGLVLFCAMMPFRRGKLQRGHPCAVLRALASRAMHQVLQVMLVGLLH